MGLSLGIKYCKSEIEAVYGEQSWSYLYDTLVIVPGVEKPVQARVEVTCTQGIKRGTWIYLAQAKGFVLLWTKDIALWIKGRRIYKKDGNTFTQLGKYNAPVALRSLLV